MSFFYDLIANHAEHAHYIIFTALMLAGINVPISEDLVIIMGALIAANFVPENTILIFSAIFLGCYLSDWVAYWIGRKFGRKLWDIKWFRKTVPIKRLRQTQKFYEKFGFYTLLVGRFIPFGVRNCLFLTAGIGKMNFGKFLLSDGIACLTSNTALFLLTFFLGKNYTSLVKGMKTFNLAIFSLFVVTIITLFWYKYQKKKSAKPSCKK